MQKSAWSHKNTNIEYFREQKDEPTVFLLAAVARNYGLEKYLLFEKRLDSAMYFKLFPRLKNKNNNSFVLFGVRACWHTSGYAHSKSS